jgi:hypothetical protein
MLDHKYCWGHKLSSNIGGTAASVWTRFPESIPKISTRPGKHTKSYWTCRNSEFSHEKWWLSRVFCKRLPEGKATGFLINISQIDKQLLVPSLGGQMVKVPSEKAGCPSSSSRQNLQRWKTTAETNTLATNLRHLCCLTSQKNIQSKVISLSWLMIPSHLPIIVGCMPNNGTRIY